MMEFLHVSRRVPLEKRIFVRVSVPFVGILSSFGWPAANVEVGFPWQTARKQVTLNAATELHHAPRANLAMLILTKSSLGARTGWHDCNREIRYSRKTPLSPQ